MLTITKENFMKKFVGAMSIMTLVAGCGVNQRLENSFQISNGMTKADVLRIMEDNPVANEFNGDLEEWHFCNTGMNGVSKYVAVYFNQGRVFAMKPYSVVEKDEGGNAFAVCEEFVKKGDYKEPDVVREYRIRYRRG